MADAAEPGVSGRRRAEGAACAVVAVCSLALGGVLVRVSEAGPLATGGLRSMIATPVLFALALRARCRARSAWEPIPWRDHAVIAAGGLLLAADLCLWNVSFFYTTLAESNLLANLVPFAAAIYGWIFFREPPSRRLLVPAVLALAGLLMLTPIKPGTGSAHLVGNTLALATAFFYTGFLVVTKILRQRYPALRIMALLSLWCAGGCLLAAIVRGEVLLARSWWGWAVLGALAITSQILGQTLLAHGMHFLSLQLASLFTLAQPVVAAFYAYLFFGEALSHIQMVGALVVLGSIYWAKLVLRT